MLPLQLLHGPRHQTGAPFALDEITYLAFLAVLWFVLIDLSSYLLKRLSRRWRTYRLSGAGIAVVGTIVVMAGLGSSIMDKGVVGWGGGIETPADAITAAMAMCLAGGVVLTLIIDLPHALWTRARAPTSESTIPQRTMPRKGREKAGSGSNRPPVGAGQTVIRN